MDKKPINCVCCGRELSELEMRMWEATDLFDVICPSCYIGGGA